MSILFRPDWPVQQVNWLTMIAGLGVAEAITAVSSLDVLPQVAERFDAFNQWKMAQNWRHFVRWRFG